MSGEKELMLQKEKGKSDQIVSLLIITVIEERSGTFTRAADWQTQLSLKD